MNNELDIRGTSYCFLGLKGFYYTGNLHWRLYNERLYVTLNREPFSVAGNSGTYIPRGNDEPTVET